ncbi:hypothetical protein [Enterovibrio calviensis]|uniref:hypothetical protein n=1 Tax=Enterovibrio calviensis TaxID=91359 RepID=UPI000487E2CD|nr:hypothetical protein [Enterovibrio calviensis]
MRNAWSSIWSFITSLFEALGLIMPIINPLLRASANMSDIVEIESQIAKTERTIELAKVAAKGQGKSENFNTEEYWKSVGIPVPDSE